MKKVFIASILFLFLTSIYAQIPEKINLHSIIKTTKGQIIAGKTILLKITILESKGEGRIVYSEQHRITTGPDGRISIAIGNGDRIEGDFRAINWEKKAHLIQTSCDSPEGDCHMVGTSAMLEITYAENQEININKKKSNANLFDAPGMLVLAPPDVYEEWMFTPSGADITATTNQ